MARIENVAVELVPHEDNPQQIAAKVSVYSLKKQGLKNTAYIDITPGLPAAVEAAACTCALQFGVKYGEQHSVGSIGKQACQALKDELLIYRDLTKSIPDKVRMLEAMLPALRDKEREALSIIRFQMSSGRPLSPTTAITLNKMLRRVRIDGRTG